jgi:uncharacterized repeat protein (TIGR01451 family)
LNCTGYNGVWTNITDPAGGYITDPRWSFTVTGLPRSEISIEKTASITGYCPGTDPLSVSIGDTVTYCFNVTNTGDVTLTDITAIDDLYGPVTLATTTLGPGESTGSSLTHFVTESDIPSLINTATVIGTDPSGGTVTDTDSCTINMAYAYGIEIDMTASITGYCPGTDHSY